MRNNHLITIIALIIVIIALLFTTFTYRRRAERLANENGRLFSQLVRRRVS